MDMVPLPFRASLKEYETQAEQLLDAWQAADPDAIQIVRHKHPRFLDARIPWLPKKLTDSELRCASFDLADSQLAVARWYDSESWRRLAEHVEAVTREGSSVAEFEAAVEAVINGDATTLASLLRENPELVRSRSA